MVVEDWVDGEEEIDDIDPPSDEASVGLIVGISWNSVDSSEVVVCCSMNSVCNIDSVPNGISVVVTTSVVAVQGSDVNCVVESGDSVSCSNVEENSGWIEEEAVSSLIVWGKVTEDVESGELETVKAVVIVPSSDVKPVEGIIVVDSKNILDDRSEVV
jgi:hypothetical protein